MSVVGGALAMASPASGVMPPTTSQLYNALQNMPTGPGWSLPVGPLSFIGSKEEVLKNRPIFPSTPCLVFREKRFMKTNAYFMNKQIPIHIFSVSLLLFLPQIFPQLTSNPPHPPKRLKSATLPPPTHLCLSRLSRNPLNPSKHFSLKPLYLLALVLVPLPLPMN
jgi:hypothetical protein